MSSNSLMALKEIVSHDPNVRCNLCNQSSIDKEKYGLMYGHSDLVAHHFCLLFASLLNQNGSDEEGVLGFLLNDIQKEIRRGLRVSCYFCKKKGATTGCGEIKCKRSFHFPCSLEGGGLFQFFDTFPSWCCLHKPVQSILSSQKSRDCGICLEGVTDSSGLWSPCCGGWFDVACLRRLALVSGYFFKCPLCNNKEIFEAEMKKFGIYVPEQDAAWEKDPNAYAALLERPKTCDAENCECEEGRSFEEKETVYELILCDSCGSSGIHIQCGKLKLSSPKYICKICEAADSENAEATNSRKSRRCKTGEKVETKKPFEPSKPKNPRKRNRSEEIVNAVQPNSAPKKTKVNNCDHKESPTENGTDEQPSTSSYDIPPKLEMSEMTSLKTNHEDKRVKLKTIEQNCGHKRCVLKGGKSCLVASKKLSKPSSNSTKITEFFSSLSKVEVNKSVTIKNAVHEGDIIRDLFPREQILKAVSSKNDCRVKTKHVPEDSTLPSFDDGKEELRKRLSSNTIEEKCLKKKVTSKTIACEVDISSKRTEAKVDSDQSKIISEKEVGRRLPPRNISNKTKESLELKSAINTISSNRESLVRPHPPISQTNAAQNEMIAKEVTSHMKSDSKTEKSNKSGNSTSLPEVHSDLSSILPSHQLRTRDCNVRIQRLLRSSYVWPISDPSQKILAVPENKGLDVVSPILGSKTSRSHSPKLPSKSKTPVKSVSKEIIKQNDKTRLDLTSHVIENCSETNLCLNAVLPENTNEEQVDNDLQDLVGQVTNLFGGSCSPIFANFDSDDDDDDNLLDLHLPYVVSPPSEIPFSQPSECPSQPNQPSGCSNLPTQFFAHPKPPIQQCLPADLYSTQTSTALELPNRTEASQSPSKNLLRKSSQKPNTKESKTALSPSKKRQNSNTTSTTNTPSKVPRLSPSKKKLKKHPYFIKVEKSDLLKHGPCIYGPSFPSGRLQSNFHIIEVFKFNGTKGCRKNSKGHMGKRKGKITTCCAFHRPFRNSSQKASCTCAPELNYLRTNCRKESVSRLKIEKSSSCMKQPSLTMEASSKGRSSIVQPSKSSCLEKLNVPPPSVISNLGRSSSCLEKLSVPPPSVISNMGRSSVPPPSEISKTNSTIPNSLVIPPVQNDIIKMPHPHAHLPNEIVDYQTLFKNVFARDFAKENETISEITKPSTPKPPTPKPPTPKPSTPKPPTPKPPTPQPLTPKPPTPKPMNPRDIAREEAREKRKRDIEEIRKILLETLGPTANRSRKEKEQPKNKEVQRRPQNPGDVSPMSKSSKGNDSSKVGKPKHTNETASLLTDKNTTKIIARTGDANKLRKTETTNNIISKPSVSSEYLLQAENVKLRNVCVKVDRSPYKEWRKNCSGDVQSAIRNLFQATHTENQKKSIINDSDITAETNKDSPTDVTSNTSGKVLRKSPRKEPHTRTWQSLQLSPPPVIPKSPNINSIPHINSKLKNPIGGKTDIAENLPSKVPTKKIRKQKKENIKQPKINCQKKNRSKVQSNFKKPKQNKFDSMGSIGSIQFSRVAPIFKCRNISINNQDKVTNGDIYAFGEADMFDCDTIDERPDSVTENITLNQVGSRQHNVGHYGRLGRRKHRLSSNLKQRMIFSDKFIENQKPIFNRKLNRRQSLHLSIQTRPSVDKSFKSKKSPNLNTKFPSFKRVKSNSESIAENEKEILLAKEANNMLDLNGIANENKMIKKKHKTKKKSLKKKNQLDSNEPIKWKVPKNIWLGTTPKRGRKQKNAKKLKRSLKNESIIKSDKKPLQESMSENVPCAPVDVNGSITLNELPGEVKPKLDETNVRRSGRTKTIENTLSSRSLFNHKVNKKTRPNSIEPIKLNDSLEKEPDEPTKIIDTKEENCNDLTKMNRTKEKEHKLSPKSKMLKIKYKNSQGEVVENVTFVSAKNEKFVWENVASGSE